MFEQRATPAYFTIATGAALTLGFVLFGGYRFSAPLLAVPPLWGAWLLASGPLARRIGHPRLGGCCEAVALIYCQGIVICAALPMLAAQSGPLADDLLIQADRALGFDWLGFVMALRNQPLLLSAMRVLYTSFVWQPALILIILFARAEDDRAWRLVNAAAVSLLMAVIVFPLFPAVGGFIHYGITPAAYPHLDAQGPWQFGPAIEAMKSGRKLITPELMVGYISFPSYHVASALMLSWAIWPLRRVRWLFVAINLGMAVSAIVVGAHYLIDLVGGFAIACAALALTSPHARSRGSRTLSGTAVLLRKMILRPGRAA